MFPRVTHCAEMARGKFLSLRLLDWIDSRGSVRNWESAERLEGFRAVMIIPRLVQSERMVLIRQYRPPAQEWVVEFPAGILLSGEDPADGARRELREETGYVAGRVEIFPPTFTSPGLSNETVYAAVVDIDEMIPENIDRKTEFDPGEMIETVLVLRADLSDFYRRQSAEGMRFDSKLAAYILANSR